VNFELIFRFFIKMSSSSKKDLFEMELSENDLKSLLNWLDKIPLSRKKRNITRDFSDAILVAEIIKFYFPRFVELHNYSAVNGQSQKVTNWSTLNRKVLNKLGFRISMESIKKIVDCQPGIIEVFLLRLKLKLEEHSTRRKANERKDKEDSSFDSNSEASLITKNPISLSQLDLSSLDVQTRLVLEEKEQALLASHETIQILQVKVRRLEHLLKLKDMRIADMEAGHIMMTPE